MRLGSPALGAILGALSWAVLSAPAAAQTPLPLANWQYSAGEVLESLAGPLPDWRVTIGGGVLGQPSFEGSKRYIPEPSVIIDVRYRDLLFASDGEGVGANLLHGPGYRAGIAMSYDAGRDHHDDHHLRGLDNIDPAPEPKLFAQYFVKPVVLTLDLRKAIGGHDGIIGDVGAYVPVPVVKDKLILFVGPTLTMADGQYMQSYFGVTAAESAASGLRRFDAGGGLKSTGFGATGVYLLDKHWLIEGDAAYERLLADAAASPIIETKNQLVADINLGYRF
ncbi:MAG TPA: MipA/OmpV family protein [Alphaproteobacteria bacterium]|nr:MipA/OmpV family protein [Alphaproteobacteria bacterium]